MSVNWDETSPAGSTDTLDSLDTFIQNLKVAVRERLVVGGHKWASGIDADSGKHACGVQGVTGVLDLAYTAALVSALQIRDHTAATEADRIILGTGRDAAVGINSYQLELSELLARTGDFSTGLTMPAGTVLNVGVATSTTSADLTASWTTTQGAAQDIRTGALATDTVLAVGVAGIAETDPTSLVNVGGLEFKIEYGTSGWADLVNLTGWAGSYGAAVVPVFMGLTSALTADTLYHFRVAVRDAGGTGKFKHAWSQILLLNLRQAGYVTT